MKKIRYILLLLIVVILSGCSKNNLYKDDFYKYVNSKFLDSYNLKENEYSYSTFSFYQDKIDNEVSSILDNILETRENKDINILYNKLMDINKRNKDNLSILKYYLNLVDNSNNINSFINNSIIIEEELSIPIFMPIEVLGDFKNTKENIVYLLPITYPFNSDGSYYIDKDYISYRSLYKQYQIKLLKEYGYSKEEARKISSDVIKFYTDVASSSKNSSYFKDIENCYNIISKEELKNIYSNLPKTYFDKIPDDKKISILDTDNYEKVNSLLTEDNLKTLKEIVKLKILENYGSFLGENYINIFNSLEEETLGVKKEVDIDKNSKDIIKAYFDFYIDNIYENKYLNINNKKYLEDMLDDIFIYYKNNLNKVNWLSDNTKKMALLKLDNIKVNIGNNDKRHVYIYNLNEATSLIEDIIKINKIRSDFKKENLYNNNKELMYSETIFNAFYNVSDNSINFPVAILTLIDSKDYYKSLGTIGFVAAHEVTHAIDINGSKFDKDGNLYNWWEKEDLKKFNSLKDRVITYYDKYKINGINVNGKNTVNENIADLGAINCITSISKDKNASKEDYKKLFTSFSSFWKFKGNREYVKMLLLNDIHSPNEVRVNALLSSNDTFYKVYKINFFDKMYIKKKDRVRVW